MEGLQNGNSGNHESNREAFLNEESAKKYRKMVFGFVMSRLGASERNIDSAEEITQDTMWLAWKNINQFKGGGDFKTWLTRIAINEINNYFRRKKSVRFLDRDMSGHTGVFRLGDNSLLQSEDNHDIANASLTHNPEVVDEFIKQDINNLIADFAKTIKNSDHCAMFLLAAHGSSPIEISAELNINVQTVKTTLFRLRQKLVVYARRKKFILNEDLLSQAVSEIRGNNGRRKGNNNEKE